MSEAHRKIMPRILHRIAIGEDRQKAAQRAAAHWYYGGELPLVLAMQGRKKDRTMTAPERIWAYTNAKGDCIWLDRQPGITGILEEDQYIREDHAARMLEDAISRIQSDRDAIRAEAIEEAAQAAAAWRVPQNLRLAAGEMTAQELRTAQAVARGIEAAIRAKAKRGLALSELARLDGELLGANAKVRATASLASITPEEDAAITAAAESDPDNPPLESLDGFKPARWPLGTRVRKRSGSWWEGVVVGTYSTAQTPDGYCVQLEKPNGPVQIYPRSALEVVREGGNRT